MIVDNAKASEPLPVSIDDIRRAARQLVGAVVRTACDYSPTLSALTGAEIFVKFENRQRASSFKVRGALIKLLSLSEAQRRTGVIAMSAGNHAQGVAYHAQRLGIPAIIVMPKGTPNVKVQQTREYGAVVRLIGETLDEAAAFAGALAEERKLAFIHPYDDAKIIAGQGTVALEMLQDVPDLDVLVAPVGGGGLIAGCAIAAKALAPEIEIIGVEAEQYASMHHALKGDDGVCGGQTLAEGIAVKSPGALTKAVIKQLVSELLLVSELDIERAVDIYLAHEKTVAEGAGAASLAAVLTAPERFSGRRVGLILSGGNIDGRLLASLLMRGLVRDGRIVSLRIEISDRPGALAAISAIIAEQHGNIVEVMHQRMFLDVPAKMADLDIVVETRDRDHIDEMVRAITAAGYPIRVMTEASQ